LPASAFGCRTGRLEGVKWQAVSRAGCGRDWWLCLPVKVEAELHRRPQEEVGIDLGLKTIAVTSDEDYLERGAGRAALPGSGLSPAPWP